jgi:hypothetical protein
MTRSNRRIEEIPEADVVRLYSEERLSAFEVGRRLGWSASAIRSRLVQLEIARRTPWARNAVDCKATEVARLYLEEGLSLNTVAARLGCSQTTITRKLIEAGVARRDDGSLPIYPRSDFSGEPTEKAYLIGLRIGDLHVAAEGSRTIVVKCTSTRSEQIALFKSVFDAYGHVYTDEATLQRRKRQTIAMEVRLNMTFEFLLAKQDSVPHWILASDEPFFAFLAGYIDAEGYFRAYFTAGQPKPQGRLEIRSYDSVLLGQLGAGLNARDIVCPPARLRVRAGYTNKYGVRSNRDLWGLGVHRKDALSQLITRIQPYLRHERRRRDMVSVVKVVS